jgi:predicted DCC family thiol-disulfide oxidoreductase YuxK
MTAVPGPPSDRLRSARGADVTSERSGWTVVYDADCGLCNWLLAGLLRWDSRKRLRPIGMGESEAHEALRDLSPEWRAESWHLLAPSGRRWSAGAALPELLALLPGGRAPGALFARFPRATEKAYGWVARHRSTLSRLVPESSKAAARIAVGERESRWREILGVPEARRTAAGSQS